MVKDEPSMSDEVAVFDVDKAAFSELAQHGHVHDSVTGSCWKRRVGERCEPNSLWATKAQVREYMAQAWDEGALLRARTHPSESVQELNPYRGADD